MNIVRDVRWGRGQETFGEDPYLTAQMAVPLIRGLQGNASYGDRYPLAGATSKHFFGYNLESNFAPSKLFPHGGTDGQYRLRANLNITDTDLVQTYLPGVCCVLCTVRCVLCAGCCALCTACCVLYLHLYLDLCMQLFPCLHRCTYACVSRVTAPVCVFLFVVFMRPAGGREMCIFPRCSRACTSTLHADVRCADDVTLQRSVSCHHRGCRSSFDHVFVQCESSIMCAYNVMSHSDRRSIMCSYNVSA